MISSVESGKAVPSLDTINYISDQLEVPAPYLISPDDDLFFYRKNERISAIRNSLDEKNYTACISLVLKLERLDDELAFILADCYFHLGINAVKSGFLQSAEKYLDLAIHYCDCTIYNTDKFKAVIPLYMAIAKNVSSPLLEFEIDKYYPIALNVTEFEFFKYLTNELDFDFSNYQYSQHIKAKQLIKDRKYRDAVVILSEIEERKSEYEYNSYILYGIYTDLELCYRQLFDFENAYRYASKRISLMEGFKS